LQGGDFGDELFPTGAGQFPEGFRRLKGCHCPDLAEELAPAFLKGLVPDGHDIAAEGRGHAPGLAVTPEVDRGGHRRGGHPLLVDGTQERGREGGIDRGALIVAARHQPGRVLGIQILIDAPGPTLLDLGEPGKGNAIRGPGEETMLQFLQEVHSGHPLQALQDVADATLIAILARLIVELPV